MAEPRVERQEVRLALVMNGGVSLAVWMGGATCELDRLRRADGAYGRLLDLTLTEARIDVIAGASAGGINGAVLALAIARRTTAEKIRGLWMRDGAFAELLRDPLERDAPSLLRGDGQLLSCLHQALHQIGANDADPDPVGTHPLHLSITATTLTPEVKGYKDHFGVVITDADHRASFTFRRGRVGVPQVNGAAVRWPDDFARSAPGMSDLAAAQLALAARSSASFPGAFEPSFCPIGAEMADGETADDQHPDMTHVASFRRSRWVIDGGVLVNTPFRPALDAIATLSAEVPVRRVLAYVVPHLTPLAEPDDDNGDTPSSASVVHDALSTLPRVQSVGRDLDEIETSNRAVRRRRHARDCTLRGVTGRQLSDAADTFFNAYVCIRRDAATEEISELLLSGWRLAAEAATDDSAADVGPEELRSLLLLLRGLSPREFARALRLMARGRPRPSDLTGPDHPLQEDPSPELVTSLRRVLAAVNQPWIPGLALSKRPALDDPGDRWDWGIAPVEHAANVVLDVLRRAVRIQGIETYAIMNLRHQCHDAADALLAVQQQHEAYWRAAGANLLSVTPDSLADEVARSMDSWGFASQLSTLADTFAELLVAATGAIEEAEGQSEPLAELREIVAPLTDVTPAESPQQTCLRRLLELDVIQRGSCGELRGIEQEVELVVLSADAENEFGVPGHATKKLTGLQVNHFGAFYKSSWRANDWMWGRMDAADTLVATLLDPRRLQLRRALGDSPAQLTAEIHHIATDSEHKTVRDWLERRWNVDTALAVRRELEALEVNGGPPALPRCQQVLRLRLQLEILFEELPLLAQAAADDRAAGTASRISTAQWSVPEAPDGDQLIAALQSCPVGRETIANEVGSDYFTQMSTRAVAVAGSMLGGAVPRPKAIRPAVAFIRGVLLAVYLLGRGVLESSRTGSFVVALVLGLAGSLVSLFLLGVRVPGFLVLLGTTALIAGVILGLIRKTWLRIVLAFLLFGGSAAAYYRISAWDSQPGWAEPVAAVAAVLLMALAATGLGFSSRLPHKTAIRGTWVRPALSVLSALLSAAGVALLLDRLGVAHAGKLIGFFVALVVWLLVNFTLLRAQRAEMASPP